MNTRLLRPRYDAVEHVLGVACPLLGALSVLDYLGLLQWAWLLLVWMSCGHYSLYFYGTYPALKHRPFTKGLFVFGIGMLWPLWWAAHRR